MTTRSYSPSLGYMTYRQLQKYINSLTVEQLDTQVCIDVDTDPEDIELPLFVARCYIAEKGNKLAPEGWLVIVAE